MVKWGLWEHRVKTKQSKPYLQRIFLLLYKCSVKRKLKPRPSLKRQAMAKTKGKAQTAPAPAPVQPVLAYPLTQVLNAQWRLYSNNPYLPMQGQKDWRAPWVAISMGLMSCPICTIWGRGEKKNLNTVKITILSLHSTFHVITFNHEWLSLICESYSFCFYR